MTVKQRLPAQFTTLARSRACAIEPVYHLISGDAVLGLLKPSPMKQLAQAGLPGDWLANELSMLHQNNIMARSRLRPVIMPVPACCLTELALPEVAELALRDTTLCPQEIVFEFEDKALSTAPSDLAGLFRTFRRRGFRIGIDVRASWDLTLSGPLWLLVDTLRVSPTALFHDDALGRLAEAASYSGVSVIAEGPMWRDGEVFQRLGVDYAVYPRPDA